jgi:hypothetical protein
MMFGFTTESKYHWHIWKLMKACKIKRTDVMTLMAYFTMGSSYEDARNKRMEENKKRMEALNLPKLSQSLYKCLPSQNPR